MRRSLVGLLLVAVSFGIANAIPSKDFYQEALTPAKDGGKTWVLLVAGSSGWMNYRHQADVCHAFQVFKQHQIPDEQIVVMMFDDLATSFFNTIKGQIFNEPNGSDVYAGISKDYTGKQVTPKHFLSVLAGDKHAMSGIGSGRVIESGPNDKVVVFFSDHGAPGMIFFPSSMKVMAHKLRAHDLTAALKKMHSAGQYGEMLLYIEACESGSMFNGILPSDINVLAMTASSPYESSYACYFNNTLGVYIGDCFSNHLWEHEDAGVAPAETLRQQFATLKRKTNTSHMCLYGDLTMASQPVSAFIPPAPSSPLGSSSASRSSSEVAMVSSRYVTEDTLRRRLEFAAQLGLDTSEISMQLESELHSQRQAAVAFSLIAQALAGEDDEALSDLLGQKVQPGQCHEKGVQDFECLEHAMTLYEDLCGAFTDHTLMYAGVLQRACDGAHSALSVHSAVEQVCKAQETTSVKSKCHQLTTLEDCKAAPYSCEWCKSAAVPSKCYAEAEAKKLPPAIFSCQ